MEPDETHLALSSGEKEDAAARKHPRVQVLYEAIRLEGQHELERPASALAWSALAAGLSMGFSLLARGWLRAALPDAPWASLIVNLGYPVGFLIVIVARQQLFTENSVTPILPLLHNKDRKTLVRVLRLWAIVLGGNLVGTFAFALALTKAQVFSPDVERAFATLAHETLPGGFGVHFSRGILAGWMLALMVWMLSGTGSRSFTVFAITYFIGLGALSHVVAGSTDAFYALLRGMAPLGACLLGFLLPTCLGNMLGGIALVALLSHAQVAADEKHAGPPE